MDIEVFIVNSDEEINSCFPVFSELRPKLNFQDFLPQVRRQETQTYKILALRHEGIIKSAAGFRFCEFLAWGKVLYIDDLTTLQESRSRGYAKILLDWLIEQAKKSDCKGVHLDTGYSRHAAHRVYLQNGFQLNCHHLAIEF